MMHFTAERMQRECREKKYREKRDTLVLVLLE
jgi:hypothetical protein